MDIIIYIFFVKLNDDTHTLGVAQNENILNIVMIVTNIINLPVSKVIPISARVNSNLTVLIEETIYAVFGEKKIIKFGSANYQHVLAN